MAILKSTQIKGDLSVTGSLNVQGNLTYVGVENLRVKDKQIELNTDDKGLVVASGQDADEAGIVIKGTTKGGSPEASILYNYANDTLVVNKTIEGTVASANNAASADKVKNTLTVNVTDKTGTVKTVFNGSEAKTVDVNLKGLQDQIDSLTGGAGSIATQISNAINDLNSDVTATATGTADKDGIFVLQSVKIDEKAGKLTSATPTAVEVEKAGAAAAVKTALIGKDTDTKDSATIKGAKKYADSLAHNYAAASHTHANYDEHVADKVIHITAGERTTWNGKQDALNANQLAAVNSGVTAERLSGYDTHVDDTTKHITASERTAWNGKQDALNTNQLNAVNSGITAEKVTEYNNHVADATKHVSDDDRKKWNAAEQNAKDYTNTKIGELGSAAKKNVLEGAIADSSSDDLVTAAQVKAYAAGVVGAMHFRGAVKSTDEITDPASGDVCLIGTKEYVYNGSAWVLFGDEGAYDPIGSATTAETNAKKYADGLNTAMDTRVDALESASHTHANMAELNKIADGDKKKWDDHVADADIHVTAKQKADWDAKQDALANANVLSAITDTQVTNWENAAAKAHEHANKTVLDGITTEKVAAWDGAVSAAGVSSVGGKKGALTLQGGSATRGDVNLSISDGGQISAAIVPDSFDSFGAADTALANAKTYADGKVAELKNTVDSLSNDVLKGVAAGTYVSVSTKSNNSQTISVTTKDVASASDSANGLALAADVKKYVDDKNALQDTEITKIKDGTTLDGRYVNVSGDTMTGKLTMNAADIEMSNNGTNGIVFGNMKIVWNSADSAIEFVPTTA